MTDIPFQIFGYDEGEIAVATIFAPRSSQRSSKALRIFEETFQFYGLKVLEYRSVPVDPTILGTIARESMPYILHAIIKRPGYCRTDRDRKSTRLNSSHVASSYAVFCL